MQLPVHQGNGNTIFHFLNAIQTFARAWEKGIALSDLKLDNLGRDAQCNQVSFIDAGTFAMAAERRVSMSKQIKRFMPAAQRCLDENSFQILSAILARGSCAHALLEEVSQRLVESAASNFTMTLGHSPWASLTPGLDRSTTSSQPEPLDASYITDIFPEDEDSHVTSLVDC